MGQKKAPSFLLNTNPTKGLFKSISVTIWLAYQNQLNNLYFEVNSKCHNLTVLNLTEFNGACDLYDLVQGNMTYPKDDLTRVGF